jgi:hypothetical protein
MEDRVCDGGGLSGDKERTEVVLLRGEPSVRCEVCECECECECECDLDSVIDSVTVFRLQVMVSGDESIFEHQQMANIARDTHTPDSVIPSSKPRKSWIW